MLRNLHPNVLARYSIELQRTEDGRGFLVGYSTFAAQEGEDWERGNDMGDGPPEREVLEGILHRINIEMFGHDA